MVQAFSEMRRIIILGCAGSGKTALARRLGERTGLPVICLDSMWDPRWTRDDLPAFRAMVAETHAHENWISDGNFAAATFDIRLPRADLVIWLDCPRMICVWRAVRRAFQPDEAHRPRDLLKVLKFIRNFDRVNRPLIDAERIKYGSGVPVIRLRTDHEIETFAAGCRQRSTVAGR